MGFEAWITLTVLVMVLSVLVGTRRAPDVVLWGGVVLLLVVPVPIEDGWKAGVLSAGDALSGLANEGVVTVAVLFVVGAGMRETGGMSWLAQRLLGRPRTLTSAQTRLMLPTAVMSAFLSNTALVAMLLPIVGDWARQSRFSVSKLLIPLSYASILGGACTLIGTSTNLIVNGWLIEETGHEGLGLFEIAWVGLPAAVVGIGYVMLAGRWLLPDRRPVLSPQDDARQYTVEMVVEPGSPLAGRTIEDAGLRHLPGLYLMEIDRDDQVLPAVASNMKLRERDRLVFAGIVESVVDLRKIRGLVPATDQVFKLDEPRNNRTLVEAVVSNTCPLVGRTIREGRFRTVYNAAVIAVGRNGERVRKKIGDIRLQPGDTLLLEARASFVDQQRNSRDFYLVSRVDGSAPPRHEKVGAALLILVGLVVAVTGGWLTMLQAAALAAGLMILTRCCTATEARRAVDWEVLLVIAAALGLGKAMQVSGLADVLGHGVIAATGDSTMVTLAVVYGLTMVLAGVITTKAAAVLMLPIALAAAANLTETLGREVSFMPFAIAVMVAAATTLATPIGFPTNLMVHGPGGYRFSDYLRIGGPLSLLIWALAVAIIPIVWPF